LTKLSNLAGERSSLVGSDPPDRPALFDGRIVQRLVERRRQLADHLRRRVLGRKDSGPDAHEVVDPGFFRRRHVGQRRQALVRGDGVRLDRAGSDLLGDAHGLLAEEVDMSADQIVHRR
jgi:hypothetical protein